MTGRERAQETAIGSIRVLWLQTKRRPGEELRCLGVKDELMTRFLVPERARNGVEMR